MKQRIKIDKTAPNTGDLDLSYLLDAPAGKHGFTKVKDGRCTLRMAPAQSSSYAYSLQYT